MKQMTLEEISKAAASGAFRKIPVSREIYSDIRTPVETLKVLQGVSSHCYMLESVEDKKQWGRYTFLGYDPSLELTCVNGNLTITADAAEMKKVEDIPESHEEQLPTGQIRLTAKTAHPGAVIKTLIEKNKSPKIATLPTFTGGLVGYFSYDYIKYSEPTLKLDAEDQEHFKDVDLMLFDKVIAYDNYRQKIVLMLNIETENLEENYEKAVQELEFLSNSSEKAAELSAKKAEEEKRLSALAETLTARRRATAEQVEEQIETALHDMEMKHARFHIQIEEKADWGADGKDKVEFLISANAGEPLKPLAKIASGGEMSRVMLALKTVLVDADEIGTFIFDEIDTGVSGRTARRVGEKMRFLGGKRQLLCITHLPQIAAMADNHFLIEKESDAGETVTRVTALDEEGAVREVARLMNDVTETTLAAARELLAEK